MKKHTLPAIIIALAVVLSGTWGSMQNVYAIDAMSLFVTAGAARAFGVMTSISNGTASEKGSQISSQVVGETTVYTEKTESSEATVNATKPVEIVITTEKTGGEGSADTTTTKTGEVAGISYDDLVMANVEEAVNVRADSSENSEILGKFYTECGGEILDKEPGWTMVRTGDLTGWISNDYLLFGDSAVELAEKVVEREAICQTDCLRVRKTPEPDGTVLSLLAEGEAITAVDTEGDWVKVEFSDGDIGYVSSEYVAISDELGKGETIEAITAREEAEKKEREEALVAEKKAAVEAGRTTQTTLTNNGAIAGDVNDVQLLAALIQAEGGNQPYEGQVSIGTVVMNRLRTGRYGGSIYSVIYAKGQFGPARSGQVAQIYAMGPKASCMQAAQDAMNGTSYIGAATHFRNVNSGYMGIVIGSHVFW